ncbi:serine carboxypeptidase S28-domain-containing protein [Favolaschia claudopus]|uniref:Serine carboxypeptidase S28-domain-containing protein n=1 Tax=Favolaschia claudopus TaxID=2862362 RepID=A0AAW0C2E1_9AGAR
MLSFACIVGALACLQVVTSVRPPNGLLPLKQPPFTFSDGQAASLAPAASPIAYFFDQLLDHSNPSLGTFRQRFWFYDGYYQEGGPVVLFNAYASLYTGYLKNGTISGAIASATGGATIVLEHRYWGASVPFADYSTANMRYFTLENSVQDYAYFAKNVQLPFTNGTKALPPPETAWILTGGSYPGLLAAYAKQTFPDLFYVSYGSSAPVEVTICSYGYFLPVAAGAPANCSADMKRVITHWDSVMTLGTKQQKHDLLSIFGLQNVTHIADASSALQLAPWSWQSLGPAVGAHQEFFDFCDTLEVKDGVAAGAKGYGLDYALKQWGSWQIQTNAEVCGNPYAGDECWGTYDSNAFFYHDVDTSNTYRPWITQLGMWQDGDPTGPSIVSRFVNVAYWERQCPLYFPPENGVAVPKAAPANQVNARFDGWYINEDHMLFVNGQFDPWRSGSVSSQLPWAPRRRSTAKQPILLVETGVHCLITSTAQANPHTRVVFDQVVAQMVQWMKDWNVARVVPSS